MCSEEVNTNIIWSELTKFNSFQILSIFNATNSNNMNNTFLIYFDSDFESKLATF